MIVRFAASCLAMAAVMLLAGCYVTDAPVLNSGEAMPIAGVHECRNEISGERQTMMFSEEVDGWLLSKSYGYRGSDGLHLFRRLNDNLFLVQIELSPERRRPGSAPYLYAYFYLQSPGRMIGMLPNLMSHGPILEGMAANHGLQSNPVDSGFGNDPMIKLSGTRSDMEAFLSEHDLSMLIAIMTCEHISHDTGNVENAPVPDVKARLEGLRHDVRSALRTARIKYHGFRLEEQFMTVSLRGSQTLAQDVSIIEKMLDASFPGNWHRNAWMLPEEITSGLILEFLLFADAPESVWVNLRPRLFRPEWIATHVREILRDFAPLEFVALEGNRVAMRVKEHDYFQTAILNTVLALDGMAEAYTVLTDMTLLYEFAVPAEPDGTGRIVVSISSPPPQQ